MNSRNMLKKVLAKPLVKICLILNSGQLFYQRFFKKGWPEYELKGLDAKEPGHDTIILSV